MHTYYVVFVCIVDNQIIMDAMDLQTTNPVETGDDVRNLKDGIKQLNYTARHADSLTVLNWKRLQ